MNQSLATTHRLNLCEVQGRQGVFMPYLLIFRVKGASLQGLHRGKACLPAGNNQVLLMNCCSLIPIPSSLPVNDDKNCYCCIALTFRALQNWHNEQNGRVKHGVVVGQGGEISLCWQQRLAELFPLFVIFSLAEQAGFKQKRCHNERKKQRRRGCHLHKKTPKL